MKAKNTIPKKAKTETPIEVKDITPKADPTGGHRHREKKAPVEPQFPTGRSTRPVYEE